MVFEKFYFICVVNGSLVKIENIDEIEEFVFDVNYVVVLNVYVM